MSYMKRRVTLTINPSEMVDKELSSDKVRKVSGVITVDTWDEGLGVIDEPSKTQSMTFYIEPGVFGTSAVEGQPPPMITEDEREYIRCTAEGYMKGVDDKGADIFVWSMDLYVVYQIITRYSYKPLIDEDGRLAIYDNKEAAQDALAKVDAKDYRIRVAHVSGSST